MMPEENNGLSVNRLIEKGLDPHRKRRVPVPIRLVAALAALIGIGTAALLLPGMTTHPITFMDALFTATSAAAVTGLAVVSTSTDFTRLGQWIILLLMQVGGLGFLVVLVLTVRLMGRRVSLMDRLAVSSSLGLANPQAILQILSRTVIFMLAVEGAGALILGVHWRLSGIVPAGSAAFYALFHAVAAFCNAGFDLFYGLPLYPEGLPSDPISLLTLGTLVIIGGLGIPVYIELLNRRGARKDRQRPAHWSLQTRLAVWSAVILIAVGWAGLLFAEFQHPGVLAELPLGERLLRTWFQSVATRTAGFPGFIDFGQIGEASRLLLICLMFIGSAPASMGGGITTGSFSVLTLAMWSFARNEGAVRVGQRAISPSTVWRAIAVLVISLGVVVAVSWLLLLSQDVSFSAGIFEVVSAFSTTGLSLGITGQLDTFGRLLIIGAMFWGRLGAVTIMLALLKRGTRQRLANYPEETVLVG
ncbi:MAG: potassium transporter [Anaerolineae bacterium]|nr:potassium transporter [Anaerolineae bacterium]